MEKLIWMVGYIDGMNKIIENLELSIDCAQAIEYEDWEDYSPKEAVIEELSYWD